MDDVEDHFWRKPTEYHSYYDLKILGYVDITCCVVMTISNVLVVSVLTRKNMISPINTIFYHISISESLASIFYAARAWHEYFRVEKCSISKHRTYIWENISVYSYVLAFAFRHAGIWMAVMLAVWRYIAIIHPLKERNWCNMKITQIWMAVGYIFTVLITIPPFFSISVGPIVKLLDQNGCSTSNFTIGKNVTIYEFKVPLEDYRILYVLGFISYGVFIKTIPSIVLAFISYRLITSLVDVKKHRKEMFKSVRRDTYNFRTKQRLAKQTNRTTKLLIVILILFIVGEVPHGVFCIFNIYYGPKFFWKYYYYGMEFCNSLTHISESFNFLIYYLMSDQFKRTFLTLFKRNNNKLFNSRMSIQASSSSLSPNNNKRNNLNRSPSVATITTICTVPNE